MLIRNFYETDAYFPKTGGNISGAIGVSGGKAILSGYTDANNSLAQLQAYKDSNNASLLQIERPLNNTTNPVVGFYQKKNGGDFVKIGNMLHTGNKSLITPSDIGAPTVEQLNNATSDISALIEDLRPLDYNAGPNTRYIYNGQTNLGTWTSISDVDNFFAKYNNANGYKSITRPLRLGDYVTIQDGTYNAQWMIAGFNMENNRTAADGTVYSNGVGICFIPKTSITSATWNASNTLAGAYNSSTMRTTHIPNIVSKLQGVLGSHLIQRNVLFSNSVDSNSNGAYSNGYAWTKVYATLMSEGQITGVFAASRNKYDDGEANYKLPIFNFMDYRTGDIFWTRGIYGYLNTKYNAWAIGGDGWYNVTNTRGVRPLIYLR